MKLAPSANTANFKSVPSPVGGLNAFNNLVAMPAEDAIALENFVPQPYGCTIRNGSITYAAGFSAFVTSLAVWANIDGSHKLFAWSDDDFFDITSPGPIGAPLISGLTNAWWQPINFANAAGTHMLAFNGINDPIWYSGAGLQRLTAAAGPGQWTGVDPAKIIQATVHQRRIWGVEVNTTKGWYLAADAVTGAATAFDFGPHFKRGGYLTVLATWTADSGGGSNDKLVAISSTGEAVVFAGTDVASPGQWLLIGVYHIGVPVAGRRFFTNVSGDLLVLTQTGLVSMAAQVTSTQVNSDAQKVFSTKIQFLLSELTSTLGDLNGWQVTYVPTTNLVFINVPSIYANGSGQLVYNTINGAWCTFQGWNAAVWIVVDGLPYFGSAVEVFRGWFGTKDNVALDGSGGDIIYGFARQAYSYLGAAAVQKQVGMYRPNFIAETDAAYDSNITYDFATPVVTYPNPPPANPNASLWNFGLWNSAYWAGGVLTTRKWMQARGVGVAASITIRASSGGELTWVSTDYTLKQGGPL